ncbi:MAG: threonine synthase [Haloquadratum walsbyi J07HQW1]|jgi:L-threonine synthase (EC 4.2.3.1)|uniref:Threonine synthase n=1 Tax=Haloquadratum walsbyi J07HQW1 TaxID=1238424 RepID=U1PBC8_9EURY|nr:MAG: threonine synthase [Haloquadratum walsbyi J07HQW1]
MRTTESFRGLYCTASDDQHDLTATGPTDAGGRLEPMYETSSIGWGTDPNAFERGSNTDTDTDTDTERNITTRSMWRYEELLPFVDPITAGEGDTPLVTAPQLAAEVGVETLAIKDESRNPTGTILDRGLSSAVTAARETDAELLALATPGNAGQSAAAYAGMAGLRSYAFVPSRTPFSNKAMVNVHGSEMRVAGGRYPDAEDALTEQLQSDWYTLQEFDNPYRHDGIKTVAFELAEAHEWSVPDAVVVPAGTGEIVAGVAKGFRELNDANILTAMPQLYAAQPSGCAPIADAAADNAGTVEPWENPDTIVGELEIPDPNGGTAALEAIEECNGEIITVDDDAILEAAVVAAQHAGLEIGTAGGAAIAAVDKLADRDVFDSTDTVIAVNTESGTKTADVLRSHLMGKGI